MPRADGLTTCGACVARAGEQSMSAPQFTPGPAARYDHSHDAVIDPLAKHAQSESFAERIADQVAAGVGSWPFIIVQSILLILWIVLNVYIGLQFAHHQRGTDTFDPYPFILLNLVLSFQAAYTGPVVMMSQNRQATKDRLMAENDCRVNEKAEREVQVIMDHLVHQDHLLLALLARLTPEEAAAVRSEVEATDVHTAAQLETPESTAE